MTEDELAVNEYFEENCDNLTSLTENYTLNGNTFTSIQTVIQDLVFEITTLAENETTCYHCGKFQSVDSIYL